MRTTRESRHSVYVVLLDEYVGTLPQMRRRNPKRDPTKPCVFVGLTALRVGRRFDFRGATPKTEWRVHQYGVRLMPELCERFKQVTGINFVEYIARTRFEKASRLLQNSDLRITHIAFAAGFQSLSQFNRVFKRLARKSPTDYRAVCVNNPDR